jgi:hypothetical protein
MALLIQNKGKQTEDFLKKYNSINEIDIEKARQIITTKDYDKNEYNVELRNKWYKSLDENKPDYDLYNDKYYFTDVFFCWLNYSKKYINQIHKNIELYDELKTNVKSILDIGNGIGYSTASLKQIFTDSKVYGSNIQNTYQWEFNKLICEEYEYELVYEYPSQIDLVFASEFYEHIEEPISHLDDILKLNPKYLIICNAFNTHSLGHFNSYKMNGEIIDQSKIGKVFNKHLREKGYNMMKCGFWNNKPNVWKKNI